MSNNISHNVNYSYLNDMVQLLSVALTQLYNMHLYTVYTSNDILYSAAGMYLFYGGILDLFKWLDLL